jgi:hypothetical protein
MFYLVHINTLIDIYSSCKLHVVDLGGYVLSHIAFQEIRSLALSSFNKTIKGWFNTIKVSVITAGI